MRFGRGREQRFIDVGSGGSRFAVVGLGQFGQALALGLARGGAEVIAVDRLMDRVEAVKDEVAYAIQFDATDVESLKAHALHEMDAAIICISNNFEATLLASVELLQLGARRVIARAYTDTQRRILDRVGVNEILSPEEQMGYHVATLLMRPNLVDYLNLSDEYVVVETKVPDDFVGKTLGELDLTNTYEVNVITIRRPASDDEDGEDDEASETDAYEQRTEQPNLRVLGVPRPDMTIEEHDTLLVFGTHDHVDQLTNV